MSIIVTGHSGKRGKWKPLRLIEVIGYHRAEQKVDTLFILWIENDLKDNFLSVLHPCDASCILVSPWDSAQGFPYHPDEPDIEGTNASLLNSVYGRMFDYDNETKERKGSGFGFRCR